MTKSTISRERLQEIAEDGFLKHGESKVLARMALSAMDSEPVAWTWLHLKQWHVTNDEERVRDLAWDGVKLEPLYRHAQPALVVPSAYVRDERGAMMMNGKCEPRIGFGEGWNACRAAMLQAQSSDDGEPTDDERIMAIEGIHNCERCGDEGWIVGEMGITRCECSQAGNSPVIPDAWIPVSERLPEEGGRYWCYVEEQNSLGKSHYQWNCSWNGEIWGGAMMYGRVTHWMPLPAAPQEVKSE